MSKRNITIEAKPAHKKRYQSLLREDWTMASLQQTLNLLHELLRASHAALQFAWEKSGRSVRGGKVVMDLGDLQGLHDIYELVGIDELLGLHGVPAIPGAFMELLTTGNDILAFAVRTWVYLAIQVLFDLHGETGFLRDIQSILFLNAVESLLPELRTDGLEESHGMLVHALGNHICRAWGDDPAHQQYLLSVLARYLGDRESEENALRSAFRLTDPDEHDYLTLAQSYWHFLLENQHYEDAEKFLLGLYRRAPREQLDEIKEMIDETFAERSAARV
jgi:tetratricopeptide (TPR) repeat protein